MNVLGALQLVENTLYSAAFLSTAAYSLPPASYVFTGFFAFSCLYWGISFSFTLVGLAPLVGSFAFFLLGGEIDPICVTIYGIGLVFFFSMGSITRHRRSHKMHTLRSEDVLNRLETLVGSCRSGVVAEMEVKMASLAHRVRGSLHKAADGVVELGRWQNGKDDTSGAVSSAIGNLERTVSLIDDFLDGLRSGAQAPPSFHLPKIASNVETADPGDEDRLEWGPIPDVWVSGQESMIALSLQSLVDNAIEAGARRVRVDCEENDSEISLTIADDGPGLPAQVRNNLFRPYNTFGKSRGVGLGIYLASQIARAAGGGLELVTSGARGTKFKMLLPAVDRSYAAQLDPQREPQATEHDDA
ncbi:MAG: HAMP domain-containing histidine kinase [Proteobacteria bacterium]|jgi:signal transduction histidine kinase|nr:HAMP domain-containing histidine kinase [Pseudomonadota bacterium]